MTLQFFCIILIATLFNLNVFIGEIQKKLDEMANLS